MKHIFVLAIFVLVCCAQPNNNADQGGGCCFYADKNYQNEIACSSQSFRTKTPVQSWFCTENYAGYLQKEGRVQAPALCADVLPETTSPVDVDEIHVFTPCPRFSDCCFYTENNQQGEEYCIPSRARPQPDKLYKSYQCLPGWKPRLVGKNLPCPSAAAEGRANFDEHTRQGLIDTMSCEEPAQAASEDTEFAFLDDSQDFAAADDTNVLNEQAFTAENDGSTQAIDADVQLEVAATETLAVSEEDAAAAAFADEAFSDQEFAAFAVEDADFVGFADFDEEAAASMSGASDTLNKESSSSSVVGTLAVLVASISLLFA